MFRRLWNLNLLALLPFILSGCANFAPVGHSGCVDFLECVEEPEVVRPTQKKLIELSPPNQQAVVAVYNFMDLTGQRKSSQKMALFSTAVTQGADNYLIDALRSAGNGSWFVVVERSSLDALTRERQLIKSAGVSRDVFRFVEMGTELVEVETGYTENEAIGYATRAAIEEAVYTLIMKGLEQQMWDYNYEQTN